MSRRSRDRRRAVQRPRPEAADRATARGHLKALIQARKRVSGRHEARQVFFRFIGIFAAAIMGYFLLTATIQIREPAELKARPIVAWLARASEATQETIFGPYQRAIAAAVATSLNLLGYETRRDGRRIESSRFSVEITGGCDGLELSLLLSAAILAFPARAGRKLIGLAVGLTGIAGLNYVRVLSLWLVGAHWRPVFDFAHFNLWPFLFICFALVIFTGWLRFTSAGGRRNLATGAATATR